MSLQEIYNEYGFPGKGKFVKIVKKLGAKYTPQEIDKFLATSKVNQLHKKKKKTKIGIPITTSHSHVEMQMDLLDMSKYYHANGGYKWILVVIDIFTKQAYAAPVKSKTPKDVLEALKATVKQSGKWKVVASDDGSEWKGVVKEYLDEMNVTRRIAEIGNHNKLGVVDRFSRTIKEKLHKSFTKTNTTKWVDELQKFVKSYNNTEHGNLCGMTPNEAEKRPSDVLKCQVKRIRKALPKAGKEKISIGDMVRFMKSINKFDKGYTIKWSLDTHKVVGKSGNRFELDNGSSYTKDQLQVVAEVADIEPVKDVAKKAKGKYKQEQQLKAEDIKQENVRPKRTVRNNIPAYILNDSNNVFI
jgi:hypothetical protein